MAAEIAPNVDFWTKVYGVWGRDQAALYDDEYLAVVYEVIQLPTGGQGSYAGAQRDLIDARKASVQNRLRHVERKVASGERLSGDEKTLYNQLTEAGGSTAIIGAADRVRVQRGIREKFRRGLEISGRYDDAFRDIFRAKGLPEDLAYLPHVESSFQLNARSGVGAGGVWQFMPATGRLYMQVGHAVDERYDPVIAAQGAAQYLANAHDRLGSWPLAVTSYNHGVGGMQRAKDMYGQDFGAIARRYKGPAFGYSSRNFYSQFLAAREVAGNSRKYFPEGVAYEKPISSDRLVLRHSLPAHHVAAHYGVSVDRLADLNPAWRSPARAGSAPLPAGTTVWLPSGSTQRVAGHPEPLPVMIAKAEPPRPVVAPAQPRTVKVAATSSQAKAVKVAATSPGAKAVKVAASSSQPKAAKVPAKGKEPQSSKVAAAKKPAVKHHVVQPNETLYRVAVRYEISVDELKRINRLPANDNTIRPGQRLRVNI
ncbi:MAG: transglycosylase SLT domain-containing protein [Chromatiaceae bacterium]|nr:transglycosylase SLT domain-containing protein [Chromatiaceae bacterium]